MTRRPTRRRAEMSKPFIGMSRRQQSRLIAAVRRQIDNLYLQLDVQLTRMAEIQLQFDGLRAKMRRL